MSDEKDNNVNQPKLNETLKPSDDIKDWNPPKEEDKPTNSQLAASMEKAKNKINDTPSIREGLLTVKSRDTDEEL